MIQLEDNIKLIQLEELVETRLAIEENAKIDVNDDVESKNTRFLYRVDYCRKNKIYSPLDLEINPVKSAYTEPEDEMEIAVMLNIDGSDNSYKSLKVVGGEFYKSLTLKLGLMYVYNTAENSEYNFANQKETVIDNFISKLVQQNIRAEFYMEDLFSEQHYIEQVYFRAIEANSHYLMTGYHALKGPLCKNSSQRAGIHYLLSKVKLPFILFKEGNTRLEKKNKGYNWLFVFDHNYINSFKIFKYFSLFIDREKDNVYGYGLYPSYIPFDNFGKEFLESCNNMGIKHFSYEAEPYVKKISENVCEKVNFGVLSFDFVVFYNNFEKYRITEENSESLKIIQKCKSSICVLNG